VDSTPYDPFSRGQWPVAEHSFAAIDRGRDRRFPCQLWFPQGSRGPHPLVQFSHYSGGHRRTSTFLCEHLASHGYVVAAMDHSEVVAPELGRPSAETASERAARIQAVIAARAPDLRFLLDQLLAGGVSPAELDPDRVGLVGHSFGGWAVLAALDVEQRVGAVVTMSAAGRSEPRPGLLPVTLSLSWLRPVPALYLAAEYDVPVPPDDVYEVFVRTRAPRRMFVLGQADHQHYLDEVAAAHEAVRSMEFPPEAAWIPASMRPIDELCSAEHAHDFVRGLTLAHLDASLRGSSEAELFLDGDAVAELAARGVEATQR
jgi:dienelactone hydrolase